MYKLGNNKYNGDITLAETITFCFVVDSITCYL